MPYALAELEDGKPPAFRAVFDPGDALPGEVVVDDPPAAGEVWDSAAGGLRPKRDEEELEEAKAAKTEEIAAAAVEALAPMFTHGAGRDETMLLVASHVLRICEAVGVQPDPRLESVVETGQKALQKKAEIEGATTPGEWRG